MLSIYIEEAHSKDEWYLPEATTQSGGPIINAHTSISERIAAAKLFCKNKSFPEDKIVVDSMKGHITDIYGAWPERLYIIVDGVIVYQGGLGPFEYRLYEVQEWLASKYGMRGENLRKKQLE